MADHAVTVHLETGAPRTGGWCQKCLLPSVVEATVYAWTRGSDAMSPVGTVRCCTECGPLEGGGDG